MSATAYKRILLTGGTADALDSVDGADLNEGDFAFVFKDGKSYAYIYTDFGSLKTENSPYIIVPDTNSGNFAWELQDLDVNPKVVSANTTLHLATTGNDTTGDGSSATPWYSLEKVFEYLADKWINDDVTVTISIGNGTYTGLNAVEINHPCASRIEISGYSKTGTVLTFTGHGLTVKGTTLALIENLTIKGVNTVGYRGIYIVSGSIVDIFNVKFYIWRECIYINYNSFAYVRGCTFYNFGKGIFLEQSKARMYASDFNANNITASRCIYSSKNSIIKCMSNITMINADYGCYATINSFVEATGVSSNTATTPYDPTATTVESAEPTWGNWGSWIAA